MPSYTIGLDYGTGSVRAILVSTTGEEVAAHVYDYPHGAAGVVISDRDPNLARQHPRDYETGAEAAVKGVLKEGAEKKGVKPEEIIGIGVDTTGSTPLPVDAHGVPLAYDKRFENDPNALAWLWKDHTSHAEAEQINQRRRENASGVSGENRQPLFVGMVLGEDSALCPRRAGRVRCGGHLGGNRRLDSGHAVRHAQAVASETRACARPGTKRFSTPNGVDIRMWNF